VREQDATRGRPADAPHSDGSGPGSVLLDSGILLRGLERDEDWAACVDVQRSVWGRDFRECVPPSLLRVAAETGGVVVGAFDDDRLLGFVLGFTATRQGRLVHWSHMLAVRAEARGHGLGTRLKLFQRERLLARGIEEALWTFDPLLAPNARLNILRLGARPIEYVVDMYGSHTGSHLHGEMATDRLVALWELAGERALAAVRGERPAPPEGAAPALVREGGRVRPADPLPLEERVLVPIPEDFTALLSDAPEEAGRWRRATRRAFRAYLSRGYEVTSFGRRAGEPSCSAYVLERPGSS